MSVILPLWPILLWFDFCEQLYLPAINTAAAPISKIAVNVIKSLLVDKDEKQQQIRSKRDPIEKLIRFDIVSHIEFCKK